MTDRRESILVRMQQIYASVGGVLTVARNLDEIADIKRPAIIGFDGDEEAIENETGKSHSAGALTLVQMIPQARILLGATPAAVGSDLNAIRLDLIKAVTMDSALIALVRRASRIRYHSTETALGHGRTMEGDMVLRFAITYPLEPSTL